MWAKKVKPPELIAGPYATPRCRVGRPFPCLVRGDRAVDGLTDAPIQWPYYQGLGGKCQLHVSHDLARAVHTEAAKTVAYHWGVSIWTVGRWRRALGVPRVNAGTSRIWSDLARGNKLKQQKVTMAQVDEMIISRVRGVSAESLARKYGLSRTHVYAILRGSRRPTAT